MTYLAKKKLLKNKVFCDLSIILFFYPHIKLEGTELFSSICSLVVTYQSSCPLMDRCIKNDIFLPC